MQRRILPLFFVTFYFLFPAGGFSADKDRMIQTVRFLSEENFPRTATPENKEKTIDFIAKTLADAGFEVNRGEFAIKQFLCDGDFPDSGDSQNPVAIKLYQSWYTNIHGLKKGKTDKRIVVGAHYDAVPESPAADDNASGVAALLELAYLLKKGDKLNCDVELVFYDIEEWGLLGSRYHAKKLKSQNVEVACMLGLDLVGYYSDEDKSQEYPVSALSLLYGTKGDFLAMIGQPKDAALTLDAKKAFQEATTLRVEAIATPPGLDVLFARSDHYYYWQEGYPALLFTDTADYRNKNYHQKTDTWDTLDYDRMAQVPVGLYQMILTIDAKWQPDNSSFL
ncbi:MAG: M28 family peptidase [Planctomycetaceae bacterium]|nr:M28 family peptidase [Planctomycetaceae bacterium]